MGDPGPINGGESDETVGPAPNANQGLPAHLRGIPSPAPDSVLWPTTTSARAIEKPQQRGQGRPKLFRTRLNLQWELIKRRAAVSSAVRGPRRVPMLRFVAVGPTIQDWGIGMVGEARQPGLLAGTARELKWRVLWRSD